MKRKYITWRAVCVILSLCSAWFLTNAVMDHGTITAEAEAAKMQENLAKEVFRFHVLANSDDNEDQEVKLKVRDRVISYMKEEMKAEGIDSSAAATKEWSEEHLEELEKTACEVIREEGYSYGAHAEVSRCYFPDKRYGDVTFPKGYYEALRICLGEAKGQNWWCVLYPNLCFMDSTCAVVSEEGKGELKEVLTPEEYEMVTATSDFEIKSFFLEKFKKAF